jgi:hypothetical protein
LYAVNVLQLSLTNPHFLFFSDSEIEFVSNDGDNDHITWDPSDDEDDKTQKGKRARHVCIVPQRHLHHKNSCAPPRSMPKLRLLRPKPLLSKGEKFISSVRYVLILYNYSESDTDLDEIVEKTPKGKGRVIHARTPNPVPKARVQSPVASPTPLKKSRAVPVKR